MDLAEAVYRLTRPSPKDELFGLTAQLRRASVSISSNIAEGHSRLSKREYIQFLSIARGSNAEVRSQLILIRRLALGEDAAISRCDQIATEVSRMLNALIASLRSASPPNL